MIKEIIHGSRTDPFLAQAKVTRIATDLPKVLHARSAHAPLLEHALWALAFGIIACPYGRCCKVHVPISACRSPSI